MCREGGVTSECERDERRGEEIMRQRKENESRRERKTSNEQVDHSRRLCRKLQVETHWELLETHWELLVGAAAGGGRGGFGMIYEQTSAGAGGSESAVDHSRVEDRCGNKMLFKGGTGGGEGGRKKKKMKKKMKKRKKASSTCLLVYWIPISSTQ